MSDRNSFYEGTGRVYFLTATAVLAYTAASLLAAYNYEAEHPKLLQYAVSAGKPAAPELTLDQLIARETRIAVLRDTQEVFGRGVPARQQLAEWRDVAGGRL